MGSSRWHGGALAAFVATALVAVPSALASPPANDNRADAQAIETFPTDLHATLAEATVERLDPQVSDCGQIAGTVWYRIDGAPDGTITVAMKGAATVAPVVRVYVRGSSLQERTCAAANAGGTAATSFQTTRGANYYVLVGRKPASADGEFDLHLGLTLPPEPPRNDKLASATRLTHLPATVRGTTVGARWEDSDPQGCGLAGATVWYRLRAVRDGLVVLRLHANGNLDAVAGVVSQSRGRLRGGVCHATDSHGNGTVAFRARHATTYFVVVGQQEGSKPGTFVLTALAAAPPEQAPGRALPAHAVRATLDGLINVNDVWHRTMTPGTTYRIAFTSKACATVVLRRATEPAALLSMSCSGYRTFTPGPDGGDTYTLEVLAAPSDRQQPYRLQLAAAAPDDIGIGVPITNHTVRAATLDPRGIDVVDIYHFDVQRTSDVKVSLAAGGATEFGVQLYSVAGDRLGGGVTDVRRTLAPGRYVVAVSAKAGTPAGRYRLSLLVRDITSTTLTLPATTVAPHATVALRPLVAPSATGVVEIQIDRFDTLGGWQFTRLVRVPAGSGVDWTPPSEGTWRVRATYLGSETASPSRSEYVYLTVG